MSFRSWRTDLCKGSSALVSVSVDHEDSPPIGSVRGVVLESQYLLEPCGTGRTRLTHICRVDLRCGCTSRVSLIFQPRLQSLMSVFLVTGEDLQNGTTRHLVTYVLTKPRGSALLFSPLTRQAPRPSSEPQKLSFVLGHTAKAAEPENQ